MVTFRLDGYSPETEAEIVRATTGVGKPLAARIVGIVRQVRSDHDQALLPSMRTSILIGRIAHRASADGGLDDRKLGVIAADVILGRAPDIDPEAVARAVAHSALPQPGAA